MSADEIKVPVWVKRGKMLLRRDALDGTDPDHTYNYLLAQGIRPEDYGVQPGPCDPSAAVYPITEDQMKYAEALKKVIDEEPAAEG